MTYNNLISQIVGLFYWQYPLNFLLGHLDFWNGDRYAWKKETGTTMSGEYTRTLEFVWKFQELLGFYASWRYKGIGF